MPSRELCVLCEHSRLKELANIDIGGIKYGFCPECFSVQLTNLLDPSVVYNENYIQPDSSSYNWIKHNISFINFIVNCIHPEVPVIEIGASSFILGKHLIEYYKDYTVFDYSLEQSIRRDEVKYIEGNCEDYSFRENSTIIMSHVFEHLYDPKKFIENCSKNKVKNILIAVPQMASPEVVHVTYHHTFLYSENDIEYIYGLNNYKLREKQYFDVKDGSFPVLFFYFTLNDNIIQIERNIDPLRHIYMKNILKKIEVPSNTVIATAGALSTIVYNLIYNKNNIIAVVDNNKKLHSMPFLDSSHLIMPYDYLEGLENASIIVSGTKKNDIVACIQNFNKNINIILL
jgi:hypothetical protein